MGLSFFLSSLDVSDQLCLLFRANGCCMTHWKRPAYNFAAYAYLKKFFAIDARNPLLNHLCNARLVGNVNFLIGFTVLTLDGYGDKRLVKQRQSPRLRVLESILPPS